MNDLAIQGDLVNTRLPERPVVHVVLRRLPTSVCRPAAYIRDRFRRDVVQARIGAKPDSQFWIHDDFGRPRLADARYSAWDINSASAPGMLVAAVGYRRRVGVDVERIRPDIVDQALIAETLNPAEQAELVRAQCVEHQFFHYWTRKEAVLKAIGVGLGFSARMIDVSGTAGARDWLTVRSMPGGWFVRSWNIRAGFVAAVAVEATDSSGWRCLPAELRLLGCPNPVPIEARPSLIVQFL